MECLDRIDWQRPWLTALRPLAASILNAEDWRSALNTAAQAQSLCNHRGLPVQFVEQAELPAGIAYEAYISDTGHVPTRHNLHDFFNALMWLAFPRIKTQLNALQSAEINRAGLANAAKAGAGLARGRLRDAATIFDENAALFITPYRELIAAVRDHRWLDVFLSQRQVFDGECEVQLFGHALMEKLVVPYKAITAHAWPVLVDPAYFALTPRQKRESIDDVVSKQLSEGFLTVDFMPLPVMGVPGWSENQSSLFYEDATVFRPRRRCR